MGLRIIIGLKTMNDDGQLKLGSGMRVRVGGDLKKSPIFEKQLISVPAF